MSAENPNSPEVTKPSIFDRLPTRIVDGQVMYLIPITPGTSRLANRSPEAAKENSFKITLKNVELNSNDEA